MQAQYSSLVSNIIDCILLYDAGFDVDCNSFANNLEKWYNIINDDNFEITSIDKDIKKINKMPNSMTLPIVSIRRLVIKQKYGKYFDLFALYHSLRQIWEGIIYHLSDISLDVESYSYVAVQELAILLDLIDKRCISEAIWDKFFRYYNKSIANIYVFRCVIFTHTDVAWRLVDFIKKVNPRIAKVCKNQFKHMDKVLRRLK